MNGTDIEVDACSFRANAAIGTSGDAYGGAVCISRGTSLVIRSTNFKTNRALSDGGSGGAIEVADGMADNNPVANVEIYDSVFTANTAGDQGGGISLGGSIGPKTTIRGCTFHANSASLHGGAIHTGDGILVIHDTRFEANQVRALRGTGGGASGGGAIMQNGGRVEIQLCVRS
jgi:predicted outer membrane repeat protein